MDILWTFNVFLRTYKNVFYEHLTIAFYENLVAFYEHLTYFYEHLRVAFTNI